MFRDKRNSRDFQYMCLNVVSSVQVLQRKTTNTPVVEQVARREKQAMKTCRVSGTGIERVYYRIGACVRKVREALFWTASRQETGYLRYLSASYLKGTVSETQLELGSRSSTRSY